MNPTFLIDENLSPELVQVAADLGILAQHVSHVGLRTLPDFQIVAHAVQHDLVCVTNNRSDYLRLYAREDIHPGLAVIVPSVSGGRQCELFRDLLVHLSGLNYDLVNKVIEIDRDGSIHIYDWPPVDPDA